MLSSLNISSITWYQKLKKAYKKTNKYRIKDTEAMKVDSQKVVFRSEIK